MTDQQDVQVSDIENMRDRTGIFIDRTHAGEILADMMSGSVGPEAIVLGIAAGGVAVGAPVAQRLGLALRVAVVNKITPPWNTEWGFGAVAYDGTVVIDESSRASAGLDRGELGLCTERARDKVNRRLELFSRYGPPADLTGREIVVADDGLATGVTMRGAIQAALGANAARIIVAVPTAHRASIDQLIGRGNVHAIYCPNIRRGGSYAVAAAYRHWTNMTDTEIENILATATTFATKITKGPKDYGNDVGRIT